MCMCHQAQVLINKQRTEGINETFTNGSGRERTINRRTSAWQQHRVIEYILKRIADFGT